MFTSLNSDFIFIFNSAAVIFAPAHTLFTILIDKKVSTPKLSYGMKPIICTSDKENNLAPEVIGGALYL